MRPHFAPTKLRETFESFQFYRRELGEAGLFFDTDLQNCATRQVFYACHGRAPTSVNEALAHYKFSPRQLFIAALSSLEFQKNFIARLLQAYPEKQRLIFVHIPKSAGSDLSTHLISRFASVNTKLTDPSITSTTELHGAIKDVTLEMLASDRIYVHGHTHLDTYVKWNALRYQDEVFTTIRSPIDQIISQINYVLTRVFSDETPTPHDTSGWRKEFNIQDIGQVKESDKIKRLGSTILRHSGVVPDNVICRYLGSGSYESAVEKVATHNVEVTNIENYQRWMELRWGLTRKTNMNESKKYLSLSDFTDEDRNYMTNITFEDQKFFDLVQDKLRRLNKPSLTGLEILDHKFSKNEQNI